MRTLPDLPAELFNLVLSIYVQRTNLPEVFRARAVSRTFAQAINHELLSDGAKIVDYRRDSVSKPNPSDSNEGTWTSIFLAEVSGPHNFLRKHTAIVLYNWVQRALLAKPLLPLHLGALTKNLIQWMEDGAVNFQYTHGDVSKMQDLFVQDLCLAYAELNPVTVWLHLTEDFGGDFREDRSLDGDLATAACVGHVPAMQYYLNLGANPFGNTRKCFHNPFMAAACTGKIEALQVLFTSVSKSGALEIVERIPVGGLPCHLEILKEAISIAVKGHHDECVFAIKDFALTQCAPPYTRIFNDDCKEIAVWHCHIRLLKSLLEDERSNIAVDLIPDHPMNLDYVKMACEMGHVELLQYLLQSDIINSTMFRSDTEDMDFNLLRVALACGRCSVVDFFYENGARPLPQHLMVAFESGDSQPSAAFGHLLTSGLVSNVDATILCNNLAIFAMQNCIYKSHEPSYFDTARFESALGVATEVRKFHSLDPKQDLRPISELCEDVLLCPLLVRDMPLDYMWMAASLRKWLKRNVQPQTTRVLRSQV